jgi:hypothetical protein
MIFWIIFSVFLYLCGMGSLYIFMLSHEDKNFIKEAKFTSDDKIALALWPIMVIVSLWVHFVDDDLF